jgi:hypothetical protein
MNAITISYEDPERLETFAREYVRSGNVLMAIQRAGVQNPAYRMSVWGERLLARKDVSEWVKRAQAEEDAKPPKIFTREVITEDLQEIYEQAMAEREFTPAVSAKKAQAELLGLMEKNVNVTFNTKVTEMPMEALEAELKRLMDDGVVTLEQGEDGVYR